MNVLSARLGFPHDEFWSLAQLLMPEPLARSLQWQFSEPQNIHHTDPRLRGYRVLLLLSELTPTDPTDWPTCTLESSGQQWRLWRLWLRYRESPLLGELQYAAEQGWLEVIYHPTWLARRATPQEYAKVSAGLAHVQQVIRRPGHPLGTGKSFESREEFQQALRKAQDIERRRHGRLRKRAVAQRMGMAPSTFYDYLRQYPGVWEGA
jgi:hypothetical protein